MNRCYIIGEIGINHNGSVETAKRIVGMAADAGVDAIKCQMKTPEKCVPKEQWEKIKETPWGTMSYLQYKKRIELSIDDIVSIQKYSHILGLDFFVSVWDLESAQKAKLVIGPLVVKIPSAKITDHALIRYCVDNFLYVMLSTGMSTVSEITDAANLVPPHRLNLAHCVSAYPCDDADLNLSSIKTLKEIFPHSTIGYSGHERGIATSVAAVAMGAQFIERHITIDRTMWGTDQSASLEYYGLEKLVRYIRSVESAIGDGELGIKPCEIEQRSKLRGNL